MAEFLCNQLYQHLILMDGAAIYALIKCTYLPTKTLPSGEATRLHTRLKALGLEAFSTVIKDYSTLIFYDSLNHDGSLRVYKHLWSSPYRKDTTKQAMLETLKELPGFQEAHTFSSISGAYDTYINAANGDELVKRLMTELEPIGIGHG